MHSAEFCVWHLLVYGNLMPVHAIYSEVAAFCSSLWALLVRYVEVLCPVLTCHPGLYS